jgi:Family of unknown function (DUF6188)
VDIVAYGDEGVTSTIRLSGPFKFESPDGAETTLDPEGVWEPLAALFVLRHDKIKLLRISNESDLRVEFASGCVITSAADASYENWQVDAPNEIMVIAPPGGGEPAIWDDNPNNKFTLRGGRWYNGHGNEISQPS